jgi:shikimate dehydrogenase
MVQITGMTRLIAHIGWPTEPFKAPLIYNPWFEKAGIDAVVVPMGATAQDYPEFFKYVFRLSNILGALVTMPHKRTTASLVDRQSRAVAIAGACNAVRLGVDGKLEGDLFDGYGFVSAMMRAGEKIKNSSALIVGAGGVGSAIAGALAEHDVGELGLYDVVPGLSEQLRDRLHTHFKNLEIKTGSNDPKGYDIIVNATPIGLAAGDPISVDVSRISPTAFVGEVVMSDTPLLTAAKARGCRIQSGLSMNYEQIPAYLNFFGLPCTDPKTLQRIARL